MTAEPWRYELTPPALRDLSQLDVPVRRRILEALDRFVADPGRGPVKRLTGIREWRLRVGDWRVRFERDDDERVIVVLRVLHRREAYRDT